MDLFKDQIPFDPKQKEAFRKGVLQDDWFREYGHIFDNDDLELAKSQTKYHFFEWLAAIHLYREFGYISLVEKYHSPSHQRKCVLFRSLVPDPVFKLLTVRKRGWRQGPDLLVYTSDHSDWFFCEVKGERDYVNEAQKKIFEKIEEISEKPVRLIHFQNP